MKLAFWKPKGSTATTAAPAPADRQRVSTLQRPNVRARYDAAQTTDENQRHWSNADALSAAAAHTPSVRRRLRDRSRYEIANNTYAKGMIATLANNTVGTGPCLQMQSGDKTADRVIEMSFWKWSQSMRLASKLRTAKMSKDGDGECFLRFVTNIPLRHSVKLDLNLYESEQVANPYIPAQIPNRAWLSDGIYFDDYGNPSAYSVLRNHPGDVGALGLSLEADPVPAANILHWFTAERPGQLRGVPAITPALPLYAQLRRYTLAVIAAAETAANVSGILKSMSPPEDPDDIEPLDSIDFAKRMLLTLPRGWEMQQLKAEQPTTTYGMFKREIIAEIARVLNMPYNVAAGDSSSYNYSSGRLDHKTYYKSIRVERFDCETVVLDPLFARWWQEARLVLDDVPAKLRTERSAPDHAWRWDGDESIDPLKEATADQVRLASFTDTLAHIYGEEGRDWEEEVRQIAKERDLLRELDLTVAAALPAPAAEPQDEGKSNAQAA